MLMRVLEMERGPTGLTTSLVGATVISAGAILSPCKQTHRLCHGCSFSHSKRVRLSHAHAHFVVAMLLLAEEF